MVIGVLRDPGFGLGESLDFLAPGVVIVLEVGGQLAGVFFAGEAIGCEACEKFARSENGLGCVIHEVLSHEHP